MQVHCKIRTPNVTQHNIYTLGFFIAQSNVYFIKWEMSCRHSKCPVDTGFGELKFHRTYPRPMDQYDPMDYRTHSFGITLAFC